MPSLRTTEQLHSSGYKTPELIFNTVMLWLTLSLIQPGRVRIWGFLKQQQGTEPLCWFRWPMAQTTQQLHSSGYKTHELIFNTVIPCLTLWLIQSRWVRIRGFLKQRQETKSFCWFSLRTSKKVCSSAVSQDYRAASLLRLQDTWTHLQHSKTLINFTTNPTRMSQNLRVLLE